jgi:hypothetical protein
MKRKILVRVIAITFMALGVWSVRAFFLPLFVASLHATLNLGDIIVGIFLFSAGVNLFKFKEFGRKFALFLLYIRVAINSLFVFLSFAYWKDITGLNISFLEQPIYHTENRYIYQAVLFAWTIIVLLTIAFLSQRDTKKMFVPDITTLTMSH